MAGIGFRLEKLFKSGSQYEMLKAHFHSLIIVAGPWIFSILSIFFLFYFKPHIIGEQEMRYFRVSLTYCYAFSLIVSGLFYLSLSRYLSDRIYSKEMNRITSAFITALIMLLVIQLVIASIYYQIDIHPAIFKLLIISLYFVMSAIWLSLIVLTALKDYLFITLGYLIGIVLAVVFSLFLGRNWNITGYFFGFFIGQLSIFVILLIRVLKEFPTDICIDRLFISFFFNKKKLVITGLLYNVAIWIDKILFWCFSYEHRVSRIFYSADAYEIGSFLAYITIIPSLSLFLICIETNFYRRYDAYYTAIIQKGSYTMIMEKKNRLKADIYHDLKLLIVNQGCIAILVLLFASKIISYLSIPQTVIPILRICSLGAFLHSLILVLFIFLLYFDLKKQALLSSLIFLVSNGVFTLVTIYMGAKYWGYGYFLSCLLTLLATYYLLDRGIKRLEYTTFVTQPLNQ